MSAASRDLLINIYKHDILKNLNILNKNYILSYNEISKILNKFKFSNLLYIILNHLKYFIFNIFQHYSQYCEYYLHITCQ